MISFQAKKINTALSLGETLTAKRQEKGINLTQAAAKTKISAPYLKALETDKYEELPGEVYAKSFLRVYARFLELDENEILKKYSSERKIYQKTKKIESFVDRKKPVERIFWTNLLITPKIIRSIVIVILVIIVLSYLGLKIKAIVSPPFLQVASPTSNLVTSQKVIEVIGQTEPESILEINGQPVLVDNQGNFSESLTLREGSNIIEVTSQRKHSKKALIYRKVIVTKEE